MAHVHGAAGAAKAAGGHAMMNHGSGAMGSMMEHAGHMMDHAGHMMASMPKHGATLAKGAAATGAAIAATSSTGKGFMSILSKHPLLVFGLGVAAGYLAHKYRKEIIAGATRVTEQGKDFVLHQRENLEDLVAECKECADDAAGEENAA
jgi:hypothetical protein